MKPKFKCHAHSLLKKRTKILQFVEFLSLQIRKESQYYWDSKIFKK